MWWFKLGRREAGWEQCYKTSYKCSFNDAGITGSKPIETISKIYQIHHSYCFDAISVKCFKASASEVKNTLDRQIINWRKGGGNSWGEESNYICDIMTNETWTVRNETYVECGKCDLGRM
jgi:hypothetical protein